MNKLHHNDRLNVATWTYRMAIRGFSELEVFLRKNDLDLKGCLTDTSVLLAASYGADHHNEACENAFNVLTKANIPIFTNVSVKHEFLEFQRRITVAEALIDFYEVYRTQLPPTVEMKLKSHRTTHHKKVEEEKSAKLETQQIRVFADLLRTVKIGNQNGWQIVCEDFLEPRLTPIWKYFTELFRIIELKTREDDNSPMIADNPSWEEAITLMGRYCLGSTDAMIVNMFFCSKLSVLLTADREIARCIESEAKNSKFVFIPDDELAKLKQDKIREAN